MGVGQALGLQQGALGQAHQVQSESVLFWPELEFTSLGRCQSPRVLHSQEGSWAGLEVTAVLCVLFAGLEAALLTGADVVAAQLPRLFLISQTSFLEEFETY